MRRRRHLQILGGVYETYIYVHIYVYAAKAGSLEEEASSLRHLPCGLPTENVFSNFSTAISRSVFAEGLMPDVFIIRQKTNKHKNGLR